MLTAHLRSLLTLSYPQNVQPALCSWKSSSYYRRKTFLHWSNYDRQRLRKSLDVVCGTASYSPKLKLWVDSVLNFFVQARIHRRIAICAFEYRGITTPIRTDDGVVRIFVDHYIRNYNFSRSYWKYTRAKAVSGYAWKYMVKKVRFFVRQIGLAKTQQAILFRQEL